MIKVKNLQFKYQGSNKYALNNINVELPRGKYIAILGHNGSGKSTFSKLISGLYKPTKGEIYIDDIMIKKSSLREIRNKIGIIFQNPDNQFIGSTVEDDLAFGLENANIPQHEMKKIIKDLLKMVGMEKFIDREPNTLSGGQKQRVAIASVLALNPEIIIFDEVTSMLDPKGKEDVLQIIKNIQQTREKTLISITHDMDEAIMADYCLIFSHGKVIAYGNPKELLNNKKILEESKIDSPFIYKISSRLKNIEPTYDINELLEKIWK
ncbi:energy-coupling factor transporter ATPase [Mesomycoplasma moatsii]|uniref:energy-coupling factor transporter ATPase n=1 Tax=Mesomycoplasma moatsii TaxID=171287 RepID=UPI0003B37D74